MLHQGMFTKTTVTAESSITHSVHVYMCKLSYSAYKAHAPYYSQLCPVWFFHTFPHLSHKQLNFWENFTQNKMCVLLSVKLLSETFLILRIHRDIIIKVHTFSMNVPISRQILITLAFSQQIFVTKLKYLTSL
jgi:hypothetical protein